MLALPVPTAPAHGWMPESTLGHSSAPGQDDRNLSHHTVPDSRALSSHSQGLVPSKDDLVKRDGSHHMELISTHHSPELGVATLRLSPTAPAESTIMTLQSPPRALTCDDRRARAEADGVAVRGPGDARLETKARLKAQSRWYKW